MSLWHNSSVKNWWINSLSDYDEFMAQQQCEELVN